MLYKKLVEIYESLGGTTKRLEKIDILSNFLKILKESDEEVVFLLTGNIYSQGEGKKTGINRQLAIKAISKTTGTDTKEIINEWKSVGDLGKVAEKFTKKKKQTTLSTYSLTTEKVLENLRKLTEIEGKGSVDKKISLIAELLIFAEPIESLYLIRTLLEDLRIGIQENTIRDAIANAFFEDKKEASLKIQEAINKSNNLVSVLKLARKGDIRKFKDVPFNPEKPIKVMLAQKVKTIEEGFEALGKPCAIEYKYDGFRLLIHKSNKKITLYTRRLENVTNQFPEVIEYVNKYIEGDSFILDSEAVGFDKKTKEYMPFQKISQRIKRKYEIGKIKDKLPVEINVFDIIYYNGNSMLDEPFEKRTKLIKKLIKSSPYKIICAKQIITENEKKAEEFYKKALSENQEGIMMKSLNAIYQPGSRVGHMLKIKPSEKDFDLTITGAEYGTGKRSGWFSSFILSCRNKKTDEYLEIGKVGTGFKEKSELGISFEELTKLFKPYVIKEKERVVKIKPKIVVSVTYQEIQKSPTYSSGFALRFPRFTALRNDKPISEIATIEEVKKEFEAQKRN